MAEAHPDIYEELMAAARWLESEAADMQDIEFTVESGRLYLLQTRAAKRSARAAVATAVALQRQGTIGIDEALARVTPAHIDVLLTPAIDPTALETATVVATGLPACPGVGAGRVVLESDDAEDAADEGRDVVLARETTSPNDVGGMIAARAVITEQGGATSHAAVVSRELHTPCVVGCGKGTLTGLAGTEVTVDGESGRVYAGLLPVIRPTEHSDPDMSTLLEWAVQRSPVTVDHIDDGKAVRAVVVTHEDPAEIAKALDDGATRLIAEHPLPVLLAVLARLQNADSQ
jgi:pyruvate,orthophosphate dikinase